MPQPSDTSPAAVQARRLAGILAALATQSQAVREEAERVLVAPLVTTLRQVRSLLMAEHVTIEMLPQSLTQRWVSADGLNRVEVAPSGDGNDNATLERFVAAVRGVAPDAAGKAGLRHRSGGNHRQSFHSGRNLVRGVDRAHPFHCVTPLE